MRLARTHAPTHPRTHATTHTHAHAHTHTHAQPHTHALTQSHARDKRTKKSKQDKVFQNLFIITFSFYFDDFYVHLFLKYKLFYLASFALE